MPATVNPVCSNIDIVPRVVVTLERLHNEAIQAAQLAREQSQSITRQVLEATGGDYFTLGWEGAEEGQEAKLAKAFVEALIPIARRHFATPGCTPEIRSEDVLRPMRQWEDRQRRRWRRGAETPQLSWAALSPVRVWRRLARRYTPERVVDAAARTAAKTLISAFDLERNPRMQVVSGRVELVTRVWLDSYSTKRALSTSCRDRVVAIGDALATFAALRLSGPAGQLEGARTVLSDYCRSYSTVVSSRERIALGGGVDLVTFHEAFKFYLPQPIAGALNVFLATHGPGPDLDR